LGLSFSRRLGSHVLASCVRNPILVHLRLRELAPSLTSRSSAAAVTPTSPAQHPPAPHHTRLDGPKHHQTTSKMAGHNHGSTKSPPTRTLRRAIADHNPSAPPGSRDHKMEQYVSHRTPPNPRYHLPNIHFSGAGTHKRALTRAQTTLSTATSTSAGRAAPPGCPLPTSCLCRLCWVPRGT
jgi:hypothetical protein